MSKHNKVNPDHYHQAGRLTPDEWARERTKQQPLAQDHKRDKNEQYNQPPNAAPEEKDDRG